MKKLTVAVISIIFVIGSLSGCASDDANQPINIFTVDAVHGDPLAFTGVITITGRVVEISQESPALIAIVDANVSPCCSVFTLYAQYNGDNPLPRLFDEVNITGSWLDSQIAGAPIFGATDIEIIN